MGGANRRVCKLLRHLHCVGENNRNQDDRQHNWQHSKPPGHFLWWAEELHAVAVIGTEDVGHQDEDHSMYGSCGDGGLTGHPDTTRPRGQGQEDTRRQDEEEQTAEPPHLYLARR